MSFSVKHSQGGRFSTDAANTPKTITLPLSFADPYNIALSTAMNNGGTVYATQCVQVSVNSITVVAGAKIATNWVVLGH